MFPQHVISRKVDVQWPALSPDLSTCNYFCFGGTLKVKCITPNPEQSRNSSKEQGKSSRRYQNKLSGEEWEKQDWNSASERAHGNLERNALQSKTSYKAVSHYKKH